MSEPRYEVLTIELTDYQQICIGNKETNVVICHMNTLIGIEKGIDLKRLANIMCDALNNSLKQKKNK